jgi:hypothetical protein
MLANELPVPMAGTAILPFVEGMVPAMLADGIDANTCEAANNIWTALSPLPPENIAATLGAIMVAASKDKAETAETEEDQTKRPFDDFAVCPYVATLEAKRS